MKKSNSRQNELEDFREQLRKLRQSKILIIVEGKKDKEALHKLRITNVVYYNKFPLYELVERIQKKHNEVIILADLDKEGKRIYSRLYSELTWRGIRVKNEFREFLFKNTRLSQIEGIYNYYRRLENRSKSTTSP